MKNRRSMSQVRGKVRGMLRDAGLEYNQMSGNTPMAIRLRNTERIRVLEHLAEFVGQIPRLRYGKCAFPGCGGNFVQGIGRRKYCTDACKAKAYRARRK